MITLYLLQDADETLPNNFSLQCQGQICLELEETVVGCSKEVNIKLKESLQMHQIDIFELLGRHGTELHQKLVTYE